MFAVLVSKYDADFPQVPSTGAANASVLLILRLAPRDVFVLPPFFHALVSSILFYGETDEGIKRPRNLGPDVLKYRDGRKGHHGEFADR
jgi:hypothetical protein